MEYNNNKMNREYDAHQLARDLESAFGLVAKVHSPKKASLEFHGHRMRIDLEQNYAIMTEPAHITDRAMVDRMNLHTYFALYLDNPEIASIVVSRFDEVPGFDDDSWVQT